MPTSTPTATARRVFVSYSRAQYYFAEDLAAALKAQGFDAWFDAERLLPGSDWQGSIASGIRLAEVLVIVGSRDAFTSAHVAGEWQSALATGQPLVVALYETAPLPDALAGRCAVADFRSSWRAGLQALTSLLAQPVAGDIPAIARPWRRWTWSVGFMLATLATLAAYLAMVALANAFIALRYDTTKNVVSVVLAGVYAASVSVLLLLQMRGVALRRFRRRRTLLTLLMFGGVIPLVAAVSFDRIALYAVTNRAPLLAKMLGGAQFGLGMTAVAMACLAALVLYRSRDFRRWLPTGEGRNAFVALRSYLRHRRQDDERQPAHDATFRLRGAPPDRPVMDLIRSEFQRFGLRESPEAATGATTVLVVSRYSTRDAVVADIPANAPVLPVIVSNDVDAAVVDQVSPYQWIDYRRRHRNTLRAMARRVRDGLQGTQMHPHDVIPEKLTRDVFPRHVAFILMAIRAACAVALWMVVVAVALLVVLAVIRVRGAAPAPGGLVRTLTFILGGLADLFIWDARDGLFAPLIAMARSGESRGAALGLSTVLLLVPLGLVAIGNGLRTGAMGQRAAYGVGAAVFALGAAGLVQTLVDARTAVPEAWPLYAAKLLFFAALVAGAASFVVLLRRCAWLPVPTEPWYRRLAAALVDRKGWIAILRTAAAMYFFLGGLGFFLVSMIRI